MVPPHPTKSKKTKSSCHALLETCANNIRFLQTLKATHTSSTQRRPRNTRDSTQSQRIYIYPVRARICVPVRSCNHSTTTSDQNCGQSRLGICKHRNGYRRREGECECGLRCRDFCTKNSRDGWSSTVRLARKFFGFRVDLTISR
jgi:hypothetical protein